MPDEAEAHGLLALLLLTESRRAARADAEGRLVRLGDQDRGRWDPALIAEGHAIVRACLRRNLPGPYQIQAAIAAVHSDAPRSPDTDWGQIVALYDQLVAVNPSPVVALNRAIAVAERDGPLSALACSTAWPPTSTIATSSTPPGPTCSTDSVATATPRPHTRRPSPAPRTGPSATCCGGSYEPFGRPRTIVRHPHLHGRERQVLVPIICIGLRPTAN
ncbi:MAG: putative polymerase, sigma-24 subunit, subfamily [Acidimicrobiales bacterium]|nr:putative polymerase, sigma-24 subunit, subfamily [Acidimicrobiales bacterium]